MRNLSSFLFSSIIFSQSLSVISELDTTAGLIGDVFTWTIYIEEKTNQSIRFPELKLDDNSTSIRNQALIHKNGELSGIRFEIIYWDTGKFATPDYAIDVMNKDGGVDLTLFAEPLFIHVGSVLAGMDNPDYQPMKGPVPVRSIFPIKSILLSLLLILLMIGMISTWRKRIPLTYKKLDYMFLESPPERALRRLKSLDGHSSTSKDYYAELSHISREYVERKYFIRTLEMTTGEIIDNQDLFPWESQQFSNWSQFLKEADLVKYARDIPTHEKMTLDKEKVVSLIEHI
ncbi:MAG: hypothetical protein VYC00_01705 [Candidatus Neomarinimicrobiota bacterium]|nr:hypothetical protein [Candidatus Neomarinimicrobiota bacterium]